MIILAAVTIQVLFKENFINVAVKGTENYTEEQYKEIEMFRNIDKKLSDAISKIENSTTVGEKSIYARVYTKNASEELVLILASREDAFLDYSNELTIFEDFGKIIREFNEEDLYERPEYAELFESEEWEEYKEANPEEAKLLIQGMLNGINCEPVWVTDNDNVAERLVEVRIQDEIFPSSTGYWFGKCIELRNIIGIENLNVRNVTSMADMFYGCSSLTKLDVSNFDTSNVTIMVSMFNGCGSLTELNLVAFDTRQVLDMRGIFRSCKNLTQVLVGDNWIYNRNEDLMFDNCGVSEVTHI